MSITAPTGRADVAVEAGLAERPWPGRLARYTVLPLMVVVAAVALYLYVSGQELDSIEQRRLNREYVTTATVQHVELTAISTAFVILLAVPLGIVLTRPATKRLAPLFLGLANIGQTVPSIGVLVLLAFLIGIGERSAIIALVAYSFLPVLRNTMVGLQQVDPAIIEAGRGMGLTKMQVLLRCELPLAVPVILAGVRIALIINVGTATLATFINAGGLGGIINNGIVQNRITVTITGAALTAMLALMVDWLAGIAEDFLRPKGL